MELQKEIIEDLTKENVKELTQKTPSGTSSKNPRKTSGRTSRGLAGRTFRGISGASNFQMNSLDEMLEEHPKNCETSGRNPRHFRKNIYRTYGLASREMVYYNNVQRSSCNNLRKKS